MISKLLQRYQYTEVENTSPGNDDCFDFLCCLLGTKGLDVKYCYSENMSEDIPEHDFWLIDIGSNKVKEFGTGIEEKEHLAEAVKNITNGDEWAQFAIDKEHHDIYVNGSGVGDEKFMYLIASLAASLFSDVIEYSDEDIALLMHLMKVEISDLSTYIISNAKELILKRNKALLESKPGFGKEAIAKGFENRIQEKMHEIKDLFQAIRDAEAEKREIEGKAFTMKYLDNDDHDLENYLSGRSDIIIDKIDDNFISFTVSSYLDVYDSDYAKTLLRNERWSFSVASNNNLSQADIKTFMKAVFVDRKYKIKGYSYFELTPTNVVAKRNDCVGLDAFAYQNPHHFWHSCLGENQSQIIECINNGDFVAAIEYCCGATRQMNLMETGVTFDKLVRDIFSKNNANTKRCFRGKDGEDYTLNELLEKERK